MPNSLKRKIQNFMIERCYKEYSNELKAQQNAYDAYMRKQEEELRKNYDNKTLRLTGRVITGPEFAKVIADAAGVSEDILVVVHPEGVLNPVALKAILAYFEENPRCELLYADEDVCIGEKGDLDAFKRRGVKLSERCCPNLKPIPSPETFLSYQYFGNIWAVRTELCKEIQGINTSEWQEFVYDFLLKAWEKCGKKPENDGIGHISEILFHKFEERRKWDDGKSYTREEMEKVLRDEDFVEGAGCGFYEIKEAHCKRIGKNCNIKQEDAYFYPVYEVEDAPMVSILIPSKDNPEVLRKCISSVYDKSTYKNYEIIVIDNGSNESNKAIIEEMKGKYPFAYLHRPMEFNYSAMNNIAAAEAKGSVLLLLNDDMEVVTADWLERMVGQLMQEDIGAVGAKLLYPDSTLIQHVGVTNAVDGPVHKLLRKDDTFSYNHGRNKLIYNVIGVTGACLMVRKSDYDRVGGLKEDLRVAYNDVDLCFSLYELGLRNVIRNDVILYHHESLSRGADIMSDEKMKRLKWERDYLYSSHPQFYCKDPYEGANNSGGAEFGVQMQPDYDKARTSKDGVSVSKTAYETYPAGIYVGFDRIEKDMFIKSNGKDVYIIQGYAILPEADNCRYQFDMVLKGKDVTYRLPIMKKLRPNMSAGFPNAKNLELCGFYCWVTAAELPAGDYGIGIFAADSCSRQKIYQDTGRALTIE